MRFSPHFQLFYFNDRLEFCEFFEWKIKRINNADLFSQPPLVIFTKGANISGGHCMFSCCAHVGNMSISVLSLRLCFCLVYRRWTMRAVALTLSQWRFWTPSWTLGSFGVGLLKTVLRSEWQCWMQMSLLVSHGHVTEWMCLRTAHRPVQWDGSAPWTQIRDSQTTSGTGCILPLHWK